MEVNYKTHNKTAILKYGRQSDGVSCFQLKTKYNEQFNHKLQMNEHYFMKNVEFNSNMYRFYIFPCKMLIN